MVHFREMLDIVFVDEGRDESDILVAEASRASPPRKREVCVHFLVIATLSSLWVRSSPPLSHSAQFNPDTEVSFQASCRKRKISWSQDGPSSEASLPNDQKWSIPRTIRRSNSEAIWADSGMDREYREERRLLGSILERIWNIRFSDTKSELDTTSMIPKTSADVHKNGDIVYREWAPNAHKTSLIGDFSECLIDNARYFWQL